jgi:hypothetical protein
MHSEGDDTIRNKSTVSDKDTTWDISVPAGKIQLGTKVHSDTDTIRMIYKTRNSSTARDTDIYNWEQT